jgi:hypothetical protein
LNSPNPPLLLPLPLTVTCYLLLLQLFLQQARITKRQRPLWNYKVVQMLDFTWEPFKSKNPQMAMRLARTRRTRVALCLAV